MQKKERERIKPRLRLDRVKAEVKVTSHGSSSPQFADAFVVLTDVTPEGIALFSHVPLMVGDEVAVTLEQPRQFFVRGRVISCQQRDADSKILSQSQGMYSYRVGIRFRFDSEAERDEVKNYCENIATDSLFKKAA